MSGDYKKAIFASQYLTNSNTYVMFGQDCNTDILSIASMLNQNNERTSVDIVNKVITSNK